MNTLKKIIMIMIAVLLSFQLISCKKEEKKKMENLYEPKTDNLIAKSKDIKDAIVVFHYQREDKNYDGWNIWVWQNNGVRYGPTGDKIDTNRYGIDGFGAYFVIDLGDSSLDSYHAEKLGFIFHKGNWDSKDIDSDRFVDIASNMADSDNVVHLFAFQGNSTLYLDSSQTNPICEIKGFKLNSNLKSVTISTNTKAVSYSITEDGKEIKSGSAPMAEFSVSLPEKADCINKTYKLTVDFGSNKKLSANLNFFAYYDSDDFVGNYLYKGDDLGVTLSNSSTVFKLWAPISKEVTLKIWDYGHPTSYGNEEYSGDDTPLKQVKLEKGANGVWSTEINENLAGKYYTYCVKNGDKEIDNIVDPYAKGTGLNGMRGYIADYNSLNPEGWEYNFKRLYSTTELIVYELHVRDLTMDSTWTGNEKNRGKYLGLAEENTTYTKNNITVKTGFDHIKELGVNAVQLQPIYDQSNDERKNDFNWGYNPQNYNTLEGQYCSNPYDGAARISEFKQLVKAYNDAGIEIIMDVVYNHMAGVSGSAFDQIVPGYYFRYNADGTLSNGSGCGNETASERYMFKKFVLDSTKFWVTEYNISGFRFDLMGLHDYQMMNEIAKQLHDIDKNIVVYGEPWEGGTTPLDASKHSDTANVKKLNDISIFNDTIRDVIKGGVFEAGSAAWIQGASSASSIAKSLQGTIYVIPSKQINYVSCHDNNTLADKLRFTKTADSDLENASVVCNGLVFTAEGLSFMLSGEEFLRSKKIYENGVWNGTYSSNSYDLPDITNAMRWDEKVDNISTFNKYKELINIVKNHKLFQFTTEGQCSNYNVKVANIKQIISEINCPNSIKELGETWSKATIIATNRYGADGDTYTLDGNWKVAFSSGFNYNAGDTITGTITMSNYSFLILYQETAE